MQSRILSIGEILWDMLPSGKKVGGAPANFAYHCQQLGADVRLVSRVGADELGDEILEYCRGLGIPTELIGIDREAPTGTVDVRLDSGGQAKYTIRENVAWDYLVADREAVYWASTAGAISFGSLAVRSEQNRDTMTTLIGAAPSTAYRVLDLNLRDPFCGQPYIWLVLSYANVLKLNDEELVRVVDMFDIEADNVDEQLQKLMKQFELLLIILTCGAEGSLLATPTERVRTPGVRVEVADTVGAGDSFTAAVVTGMLRGKSLTEIGAKANELGAYVSSQHGGMPRIPDRFCWND